MPKDNITKAIATIEAQKKAIETRLKVQSLEKDNLIKTIKLIENKNLFKLKAINKRINENQDLLIQYNKAIEKLQK